MPDADLVAYIQDQTAEGVTAEALRESLMSAGWHELDVENAFHDVAAGLHPATPGASIHEDLAQVRGMVAHLANRIRGLEATLASVAGIRAQAQLPTQAAIPSTFIGPDHELPPPHTTSWMGRFFALCIAIAGMGTLGAVMGVRMMGREVFPFDEMVLFGASAAFLMVVAVVAMRRHHPWTAILLSAIAASTWLTQIGIAWWLFSAMSATVAAALCALVLVVVCVMGVWTERLRA
jgi:hypothetical protein